MKKLFTAMVTIVIIVILTTNYSELYAVFFNRFSKETTAKVSKIDFTIDGDFNGQQQIKLDKLGQFDENNEEVIDIDFDIKNNSDRDIYVRVAILPVILDNPATNTAYKLSNSSCKIQYYNGNNLDDEYWAKSDDGYYYYKKAVKKGANLEDKLISGIKLKLSKSEIMDLSDKQMQILVRVESKLEEFNI